MIKRLLTVIFMGMILWINAFTIDYMLVYNGNKPLFYWREDQIKKVCGDKAYVGLGYIIQMEREMDGDFTQGYTCHETGRFKVCRFFSDCSSDY